MVAVCAASSEVPLMLTRCGANEPAGAGTVAFKESGGWELAAKVSTTAMLPASHCETYTLKLEVLPPPEEVVKTLNPAEPHPVSPERSADCESGIVLVTTPAAVSTTEDWVQTSPELT